MKFTAEDFARYKRAELDRAAMFKAMAPLRRDLPPGPALVYHAPTVRENLSPDDIFAEDFDHHPALRDKLAGRITESSMSTVHKRRARAELDMLWARAPLPPGYDVCLSDYGGGWVPVKVDTKGRMLPGSAVAVQRRAAPRGQFVTLDSAIAQAREVYELDEADMAADEAADWGPGDHA